MHEITPDMLEAGEASELCHNYYTSPSGVLTAGVWKCTAHTLQFAPYPVDEFMFDTRRGFCEHYASSFTVLMRAAGIPARG